MTSHERKTSYGGRPGRGEMIAWHSPLVTDIHPSIAGTVRPALVATSSQQDGPVASLGAYLQPQCFYVLIALEPDQSGSSEPRESQTTPIHSRGYLAMIWHHQHGCLLNKWKTHDQEENKGQTLSRC
jgi:hypothetical protein